MIHTRSGSGTRRETAFWTRGRRDWARSMGNRIVIAPPARLSRIGLEALPAVIEEVGEDASRRAIEFFDRTNDEITLDEIERMAI